LAELLASGELGRRLTAAEYRARAEAASAGADDEAALMSRLRRLRHRELVRIAWRDIRGDAALADTMAELSDFADAVLAATLGWLHRAQVAALGSPCDSTGALQTLIVLAMGKLGAQELNFSSDIDLILCYPAEGETRGGPGTLSNQAFFERQGQRLIRALSEVSADGFVFRVDTRLRPFGDAGPLVMSFDALERYYSTHGRDWERYALIKARPAAGDAAAGQRLRARLMPFVYRRYLDFGAIGALREMKRLIDEEGKRKGLASNIKQGPGGIREIEFIGQTFSSSTGDGSRSSGPARSSTSWSTWRGSATCRGRRSRTYPAPTRSYAPPSTASNRSTIARPKPCRNERNPAPGSPTAWGIRTGRRSSPRSTLIGNGCSITSTNWCCAPKRRLGPRGSLGRGPQSASHTSRRLASPIPTRPSAHWIPSMPAPRRAA